MEDCCGVMWPNVSAALPAPKLPGTPDEWRALVRKHHGEHVTLGAVSETSDGAGMRVFGANVAPRRCSVYAFAEIEGQHVQVTARVRESSNTPEPYNNVLGAQICSWGVQFALAYPAPLH